MNMQIKIESDVPAPEHGGKYPFARMKVGDSFAIADDQGRNAAGQSRVRSRISVAAGGFVSRNNKSAKFRTRTLTENGKPVVRIWRIK